MKVIQRMFVWWFGLTRDQRAWLISFVICYVILMSETLWFASETRYWRQKALVAEFDHTYLPIGGHK